MTPISAGNLKLRAELNRLTTPPPGAGQKWLDGQIVEIEKLKQRYLHSIRLHTRCTPAICELNCFMFALGIMPDSVRDMCRDTVFPGKDFFRYLVTKRLLHETDVLSQQASGGIVVYFQDGIPEHAGKIEGGKVTSKWGSRGTHIWQHGLWELPENYGNEKRFFEPLPDADSKYREWAAGPRV